MEAIQNAAAVGVGVEGDILEKANAKTWDGLSRMAFAANWDPEGAIDWSKPIELGEVKEGWINILHYFYEGEWQGLEIIQRLMNRAAHQFKINEMVTYYSTKCADEAKHVFFFSCCLIPMRVERWILATYFTETLAGAIFQRTLQL